MHIVSRVTHKLRSISRIDEQYIDILSQSTSTSKGIGRMPDGTCWRSTERRRIRESVGWER